ncbi:MAG: BLUF domain-containing protein [Betaproteobacteria bacterium]
MILRAVAYVSTAARALDQSDLDALLIDARDFNVKTLVTGALLYDAGVFFQYFEGPEAGMVEVYDRIKNAKTHQGLIELLNRAIDQRLFAEWHMGFSHAPGTVVQQLANAKWYESVKGLQNSGTRSIGMDLLLDFWASARRMPG